MDVLTTIYNSPTSGLSSEQRTQTEAVDRTVVKTVSLDPAGKPASLVQTRTPNLGIPIGGLLP